MKKININYFRESMSKFATGITVITLNKNNFYIGKTVNSFASLSLKPPLVLFSLDKKSSSLSDYKKTKYLGINILSNKQKTISNYFSSKKPKWNDTKFFLSKNKVPMIKDCIANLNCKKIKNINIGDHVILICEVTHVLTKDPNKPLIYFNSKYL